MTEKITEHEYDVIVIGAGGAGSVPPLRQHAAAPKPPSSQVTARQSPHGDGRGGCAAALQNADPRDGWKVHFHDTMKGSKWLANWRMAEFHAKEAPDRVRELEQWGAVFDRTPKDLINQRNSAATPSLVSPTSATPRASRSSAPPRAWHPRGH